MPVLTDLLDSLTRLVRPARQITTTLPSRLQPPDPQFLTDLRDATGGARQPPRPAAPSPAPSPPLPAALQPPTPPTATRLTPTPPAATPRVVNPPNVRPGPRRPAAPPLPPSAMPAPPPAPHPLTPYVRARLQSELGELMRRMRAGEDMSDIEFERARTLYPQVGLGTITLEQLHDVNARGRLARNPPAPAPTVTPPPRRAVIPPRPAAWIEPGSPQREWFDRNVGRHGITPEEFTEQYLGGWHGPDFRMTVSGNDDVNISGTLRVKPGMHILDRHGNPIAPGTAIGTLSRDITPHGHKFHNAYFALNNSVRGGGIGKWLLKKQYELYPRFGITHGDVFAALDMGGYVWSKFGFIPTASAWRRVSENAMVRARRLQRDGHITSSQLDMIDRLVHSGDPKTIWALADINIPLNVPGTRDTLGKTLLMGQSWDGKFNLHDRDQMDRFNAYTRNARSPFTAAP